MNTNYLMLAAASGEGLVRQLLVFLIVMVCALLIWSAGKWAIASLKAPPHALTVWNGLFIFLGLLVVINFLLSLIGYPIIRL